MSTLGRWGRVVWYLLNRQRLERELEREMDGHRTMMRQPHDFGDMVRLRERSADVWGWTWVDDVRRDVHHGVRLLAKSPGFTLVAAAALAVGIGANLTIFGFVNTLLLRPLPVAEPSRLVRADLGGPNGIENAVPYDDYLEYRDRNHTLAHLSLFHPGGLPAVRLERRSPEPIHVMPVTGNYFETLGVKAAVGRTFSASDDQPRAGAVVLSHEGWTRHFDADPRVVGQTILISGTPFSVVGVTPESFTGTIPFLIPRIYATWRAVRWQPGESPRGFMIGRLDRSFSLSGAQADFARIAAQLRSERKRPVSIAVYPPTTSMPGTARAFSLFASLFMLIVGVVLWVACSNIAILQLARTSARRPEMEIRLAVGATRIQLIRQLLTENVLLAMLAGTIGVALAVATARWLTQLQLPVPMPIALTFALDWRMVVFALTLSFAATLLSGLGGVLDSGRTSAAGVLRNDSAGGGRPFARKSLIITQVAMSTILLVTAVALVRSLTMPYERGLDAKGVLITSVSLPSPRYSADQVRPFFERLLAAAESAQSVESATVVETIPLANNRLWSTADVTIDGPAELPGRNNSTRALVNYVSRGHFRTLGIPLIEGRDFGVLDDERAPRVAILNETLARRYWPGQSAVGRQLRVGSAEHVTVVGVARDSKYQSLVEEPQALLYRPFGQVKSSGFEATLLTKVNGDPRRAVGLARSLVSDMDPNLVVFNLNTLEDRLGLALLPNRAAAVTSGVLGLVALALGSIGTYSVMAFLVLQRRREIGIRIALGALPSSMVGFIAGQGMRWVAIGLALGLVTAFGALRLLQGLLIGVSAWDPIPLGVVVLLLGATGFVACYVPALHARKRDPLAILRQ
jgi:predicted permease